jgi:DNA-binding HxlR family transcriptional regulator
MARKRFTDMNCGIAQALEQIGDWWTLLIVREAFFGSSRFGEFQEQLGIARNILSERLQRLVADGILSRVPTDAAGRRAQYHLTRKGRDLWIVLTALRLWADRWIFEPGREPLLVKDGETGAALRALLAVDAEGNPLDPRSLVFAPGPGASAEDRARFA